MTIVDVEEGSCERLKLVTWLRGKIDYLEADEAVSA